MSLLRQEVLEELRNLCENHSVDTFYLFGSKATGNGNPDSDYDFLVRFSSEVALSDYSKNYFHLLDSLKKLFDSPVDLLTEQSIKNPILLQEINSQKQLIYEAKVAQLV